jgi:flagellin-like protein
MNKTTFRMKGSKKAVTPVIATIILIAGTLVLALVVGAYTFGLFGSNVKTITLPTAILTSGTEGSLSTCSTTCTPATASLYLSFNNPGSATYISSISLSGAGFTSVTAWGSTPGTSTAGGTSVPFTQAGCTSPTTGCGLNPGSISQITIYPQASTPAAISSGQTYTVTINFGNGQSISQPLVAS